MAVGAVAFGMFMANIAGIVVQDIIEKDYIKNHPDYKDDETIVNDQSELQAEAAETTYQIDESFLDGSGNLKTGLDLSNDEEDSIAETNRKQMMRDYFAADTALKDQQQEVKSNLNVSASRSGFKVSSGVYKEQRTKIDSDYQAERDRIKSNAIGAIQNLEKGSDISYKQGLFNSDLTMQNFYREEIGESQEFAALAFDTISSPINFLSGQGAFEGLFA